MPEISVIIPVYQCERCLWALQERLCATLEPLISDFEIIYVDDVSPDDSWQTLQAISQQYAHTRAIQLSRNFGQHAAITAGLAESQGQWAVVMDCDLQDPPETIAQLYQKTQEGFDIVFAYRKQKRHSGFRRLSSCLYAAILNRFVPYTVNPGYGSFSLIARPVVNAYLKVRNRDQHYLFILNWLGFKSTSIEYAHGARHDAKQSSYNLLTLLQLATEGLLLQTTQLLRCMVWFGLMFALSGFFLASMIVYQYFSHSALPGWTSLSVLILVVGGAMIVSLSVVGLYVGKIFEQVQERPQYVVARRTEQTREAMAL